MTTPKWLQRVPPEEAARMARALCRNEHNVDERDLLLDLCERAMKSRNPGESASMTRYRDAIAAGRRIKYVVLELEVEDGT